MRPQSTRVSRTCARCGKTFTRYPSQLSEGRGVYCSRACKEPGPVTLMCAQCDTPFSITPANIGRARFCSRRCHGLARAATLPHKGQPGATNPHYRGGPQSYTCEGCQQPFTRYGTKIARFCGDACRNAWWSRTRSERYQTRMIARGELIAGKYGPRWPAIAEAICKRDSYACTRCGKADIRFRLHVHHIAAFDTFAPQDAARAHDESNLTTLCISCHRKVHKRRPKASYVPAAGVCGSLISISSTNSIPM